MFKPLNLNNSDVKGYQRDKCVYILTMSSRTENRKEKTKFVTTINSNDVLMGRGANIDNNEGNKRFRELVRQRKDEYMATSRHPVKQEIAGQIYEVIGQNGGSFLRKIEDPAEARELGVTDNTEAWVIVSKEVALKKVKQALRGHDKSNRASPDNLSLASTGVFGPSLPVTRDSSTASVEQTPSSNEESKNEASLTSLSAILSNLHQRQLTSSRENHTYDSLLNLDNGLPSVQGSSLTNLEKILLLQRLINSSNQSEGHVSPLHQFLLSQSLRNLPSQGFTPVASGLPVQTNSNPDKREFLNEDSNLRQSQYNSTPGNNALQNALALNNAQTLSDLYRGNVPMDSMFPPGLNINTENQSRRLREPAREVASKDINELIRIASLRKRTESILLAQLLRQTQTSTTLDRIGNGNGGFGVNRSLPLLTDIQIEAATAASTNANSQLESSLFANSSFELTKRKSDVALSQSCSTSSTDTDDSPKAKKFKSD